MKSLLLIIVCLSFGFTCKADEGLWVPMMLEKYTITQMQAQGFKLTSDDIYSINQASLKDAVVGLGDDDSSFFHFCTGEIISSKGLILTNYHCVHDVIQQYSTLSHNYLQKGFWAEKTIDEMLIPGLTASILVRMEDVTEEVLSSVTLDMDEKKRETIIKRVCDSLEMNVEKPLRAKVSAYFYGNQYLMSVYKIFGDVRLVGAPQERVGKFGGDTDNWMFPRHTGDFALLRIYADKENEPTDASMANKPYKPVKSLEISTKGVKLNEFAMVLGYPGRTEEYLPSFALDEKLNIFPCKIQIRDVKLNILKEAMENDETIAIKYTAKAASISNAWKKWQGELKGLEEQMVQEKKKKFEQNFALAKNELYEYSKIYKNRKDAAIALESTSEALIHGSDIIPFALSIIKKNRIIDTQKDIKNSLIGFYDSYDVEIDCNMFVKTWEVYQKLPIVDSLCFKWMSHMSPKAFADTIFKTSIFTSSKKLKRALSKDGKRRDLLFGKDLLYQYIVALVDFERLLKESLIFYNDSLNAINRTYMAKLMQNDTMRILYPDANSTMRVSYGTIQGYEGEWQTYLSGMMKKGELSVRDYAVSKELADAFSSRNYGRYGENGDLPICFTSNCHTSGGNSGSPVLDCEGHLVGINFDRAWQGVMSDTYYDPSICRNIALDIRFVLFYMEKIAKVPALLNELQVIH